MLTQLYLLFHKLTAISTAFLFPTLTGTFPVLASHSLHRTNAALSLFPLINTLQWFSIYGCPPQNGQ